LDMVCLKLPRRNSEREVKHTVVHTNLELFRNLGKRYKCVSNQYINSIKIVGENVDEDRRQRAGAHCSVHTRTHASTYTPIHRPPLVLNQCSEPLQR
jgi:hypothetical protein